MRPRGSTGSPRGKRVCPQPPGPRSPLCSDRMTGAVCEFRFSLNCDDPLLFEENPAGASMSPRAPPSGPIQVARTPDTRPMTSRVSEHLQGLTACSLASVVAVPNRPEPDAVVGTATVATPFATKTTLAEAIVAMPAARPALTRTMPAMNLNKTVAHAIRQLADIGDRRGAGDGSCRCQKRRRSQSFQRSNHFHSPSSPDAITARIIEGSARPVKARRCARARRAWPRVFSAFAVSIAHARKRAPWSKAPSTRGPGERARRENGGRDVRHGRVLYTYTTASMTRRLKSDSAARLFCPARVSGSRRRRRWATQSRRW